MKKMTAAIRLLAPVAALILVLSLSTAALAQQAPPATTPAPSNPGVATPGPKGNISGTVTNGTKSGGSIANLDVNLYIYQGQSQSGKLTTRSGPDGKFSFDGVDTGPEFTYLLHTLYQEADYASEPITFTAGATQQSAVLEVYDSTPSDENIKVSAKHYLLDPEPDGLYVSEIAIINNSGDKTYVGSKEVHQGVKETLRFPLPEGAQNVEYGGGMMGTRVFQDNGDLVDTWPLYPGDSQRIFRYQIAISNDAAAFVSKLKGDTAKVNVLIPDAGEGITVSNLPNQSSQDIQGQKYLLLSGDGLKAGTSLEFKLSNLGKAIAAAQAAQAAAGAEGTGQQQAPGLGSMLMVTAGSGIIVVVMIASLVTFLVRRRNRRARPAAGEGDSFGAVDGDRPGDSRDSSAAEMEAEEEILNAQKRELVTAIARLDDDFEAQRISAEEYGRLRAEKKRRLVQVVDRQKSLATARGDQ